LNEKAFRHQLTQTLTQHGFPLTPLQQAQFTAYGAELKRWNARMNLTAIRDDREVIFKHFLDSLSVLHHFPIKAGDTVIDIGTGAGFPGMPLKIYIPEIELTLVEAASKKASFLRFLILKLKSTNTHVSTQRAEECAKQKQHIRAYDWVLTRYVASLADSADYCLPLLKPGGTWIAYKSLNPQDEVQEATPKLQACGGQVQSIFKSDIAELNRSYVAIKTKEHH
jgi:16S rRNA (guanine527-N7)-methyltransferase